MIIVFKDKKSQQYSETKSEGYKEKFALQFRLCVKSKLENDTKNEDSVDDGGDFKYDWIIRKIPALGRSTHLRTLSELYHGQKYDYIVVSTRKCPHIVLKKIQLSEGNVKKPGSKIYDGKTYVKARVLQSMKKSPFRVVVEFTP